MKSLNCPNCGAAVLEKKIKADIASCEYCGTSFRIVKTYTPEPDMGDLILGTDFSNKIIPGFQLLNEDNLTFHSGNPPELRGKFTPNKDKAFYMLKTSGLLDDFDVSATLRFTEGDVDMIRAGYYFRFTDEGGYTVFVSALGTYQVGVFTRDKEKNELVWKKTIGWTAHTALKKGFNESNRLRVICKREQFRVYLNGVLATSFKDSTFAGGNVYLTVDPSANLDGGFAYSDLQLREAMI